MWSKVYGAGAKDVAVRSVMLPDSGLAIAGWWSKDATDEDACLVRTDKQGNTLWVRKYGGLYNDRLYDMIKNSDGGFTMTGFTESYGAGYDDVYILKTDSIGKIITGLPPIEDDNNLIVIQPNPFSKQAVLSFPNPFHYSAELVLMDISGKVVRRIGNIQGNRVILEKAGLMAGVYLYELKVYGGKRFTGKLAVE